MKDGQILVQVSVTEPEPPDPPKKRSVMDAMSSTITFSVPKRRSRQFVYAIRREDVKKATEIFNKIEDMLDEQFGPPKWKEAHRKETTRTE